MCDEEKRQKFEQNRYTEHPEKNDRGVRRHQKWRWKLLRFCIAEEHKKSVEKLYIS